MAHSNVAVLLRGKNDLAVVEYPIPEPGKGEVQIRIDSVGICGSDVHFWKFAELSSYKVTEPLVLGHESSGTISKVGEGVSHLKVGDRVAIEPGIPCHLCDMCRQGHYNLCPDIKFLARPFAHGTLTRLHVHSADFCHKLPSNVSFEEGALAEPLSVAVHACKRAPVMVGHKVLICGAGPIGLVNLFVAWAMGASEICLTDISAHRLAVAKELGAHHTVLVTRDDNDAEITAKKVEEALGDKPDVTIECSGAQSGLQAGLLATKSRGTMVVVGVNDGNMSLPIHAASVREITIKGSFCYANDYPTAIAMIASGSVDVKPLITHRFVLEEALEAFRVSESGEGGAIKVMIKCNKQ